MDLKIKDVAELLNVSETTIRRWLVDGKIPAYRLNHQFRFSRDEIESWVMSCKMGKDKENSHPKEKIHIKSDEANEIVGKKIGTQVFSLYRSIHRGGVLTNIEGNNKEDIIVKSVAEIAGSLHLDQNILSELLLDREQLMSTSINHGVAVPHTRDFLLPKSFDAVTVVYLENPIDWGAIDGKDVHTLFFLFACSDKRHLHLLSKLAHFTRSNDNLNFLQTRPSKAKLLKMIKSWEAKLNLVTIGK